MTTLNNIEDLKAPCYMSVHFHALLTQHLGMRCYRSEEKYKFHTADRRFVQTWKTMWGNWCVRHNIRSEHKFSNWEEAEYCDRNYSSVCKDFRLTGMGMMTSDLSEFMSFVLKNFKPEENILLHPEKRQLNLFQPSQLVKL